MIKQEQLDAVLHFIEQFCDDNGYAPSIREICKGMGLEGLKTRILDCFAEEFRFVTLFIPYDKLSEYNRIKKYITERTVEYTDEGQCVSAVLPTAYYAQCKQFIK